MKLSRREWLTGVGALALTPSGQIAGASQSPGGTPLVENKRGGYLILPGVPFLCFAALAAPGFAVVRAAFRRPPTFSQGLARIEDHLSALGLSLRNLCGLELRSGRQLTVQEFDAFNRSYVERMDVAGLTIGGSVPIARTNVVVPSDDGTQYLHAFSFTIPTPRRPPGEAPTFVLSAVPEVRYLPSGGREFVASGDTSPKGLREKTAFILETVTGRLETLGVEWADVTGLQLYSVQNLHPLISTLVLPAIGEAGHQGIQWHHAKPPTAQAEIELDVRSTHMELMM